MINKILRKNSFAAIYTAAFLSAFHAFILIYINSSFLNQFVSEKTVGALYIIGSLASIAVFIIIPIILRSLGNYLTLMIFAIFEMLVIFGMAFIKETAIIIPLFIAYWVASQIIFINIDIFFESYQKKESDTGVKRGVLMTIINSALVLSIFIVGFILKDSEFWKVYLASALALALFLFVIFIKFRKFKDLAYENFNILNTLKRIYKNKNITNIFIAQLFLKFFFSWMVIYMPIYLHDYIGFDWPKISIIFTIMLLPFIIFEIPVGKIADIHFGEKELLSAGFIITAIFTIIISFISIKSFILWAIILFATRVGASLIEITTESYFFKHVKGDDADIISFFRINSPLAYIAGPIAAIISLQFLPFQYIFLVLGIIMFVGLKYSFALKDTR
ncbi:hypothetical protein COT82_00010 [Candidatus Campbellbacteria bacterium CG10_big_fil_rev_8_21_14_0_10_35_52]|uniref:Major facilitator superfamily (MFS) profile domain-containing protein n=1 Tax=Candidatus Campbellbacteria bacterium CG10_big_fil_rev_8_21_14_0_10_35_52 TaxID=1974527 RepID=A0A2M6WW38_9BACT|nr:MAG: hypothetical protein COT82_00010 [Candidatus Campbellbacteria bacterium CG10_big_fil_rev_8_21_14_0_10_35_52]